MSWLSRQTVYNKILFMSLSIIFLLSLVLGAIVWDSMDDIVAEQLIKRGTEIASHVASLSANYVLVDDYYSLFEVVNQTLTSTDDVRYILVIDNNQRLLAHTFTGGLPKSLLEANAVVPAGAKSRSVVLDSDEGLIYDIIVPIENGSVGFVRVGMTEQHTRGSIMEKIRDLILATLTVAGITIFFSAKVTALITRPIRSLAQVAEAITHGKLDVRARVGQEDEVGKLARTFNEMTASLIAANTGKERLLTELQAKEQLRDTLIQKLITAQEDERKRISRELHDETSQALTSLMVTMRILADEASDPAQREALLTSRDVAAEILREIRDLAVELRPPVLDDLGLVPAIEKYLEKYSERYGLQVELDVSGLERKIDGQIAVALYRIVQEGLNNVVKHAKAKKVGVSIHNNREAITLKIADDGQGISGEDLRKAQEENRLGIYGMRERVELLGGRFTIETTEEGGAVLRIVIPHNNVRDGGDNGEAKA